MQPAARKIMSSSQYHLIKSILQASQSSGQPVFIKIHFQDDDIRWLPLHCLNSEGLQLYKSLKLKIHEVRQLRSRV